MKKKITMLALAGCTLGSYAQDLTSKKGEQILPEGQDWSIGVDATPFLEYAGNFFGKTTVNSAPTFNFLNSNQSITGKYFTDAQTAYRASLRLGFGGNTQRQMVQDRFQAGMTPQSNVYPTPDPQVENVWKHSQTNIGIAAGMEKRKGKTRLQGYYGAEAGISVSSSKDKFTYGNKLNPETSATSAANPSVGVSSDDNFPGASNITSSISVPGMIGTARVTERKNGATISFGVRGFIGVEYFILPKISLGGEFGLALGMSSTGKSTTTYESVGNDGTGPDDRSSSSTIEGANRGSWQFDTDNLNSIFGPTGSLRLNFHF